MEIEISGSYPIILDGETTGEVTVTREGLFWSFDAKCEPRSEIVRLSVYGDGREGYLGIMEPFGDMLRLTKKFSRSALSDFPMNISHAGEKGETDSIETEAFISRPLSEDPPQYSGEFPRYYYNREELPVVAPPEDNKPPPFAFFSPPEGNKPYSIVPPSPPKSNTPPVVLLSPPEETDELEWLPCPMPCSLFSGVRQKKVCSYITGAYIAHEGEDQLLAIPEDIALTFPDSSAFYFIDKIYILGNLYLICRIRQGKCISEL